VALLRMLKCAPHTYTSNFVSRTFVLLREDAANEGQVERNLHGDILILILHLGQRMRAVQKRWAHACNARAT
jgi:hypothetical protein